MVTSHHITQIGSVPTDCILPDLNWKPGNHRPVQGTARKEHFPYLFKTRESEQISSLSLPHYSTIFVYTVLFLHRLAHAIHKVKSLSCVQFFTTPWTVAYQAPLSMGFSRQEYWSGLPFPSPGDLPNPGNVSCIVGRCFNL